MTEELQLDYSEIQETVERLLPKDCPVSVTELFEQLESGGGLGSILEEIGKWLLQSVTIPVEQGIRLLFLVLFSALFSTLSKAFQKNGASQMGVLCMYLLVAIYITSGFQSSISIATQGLEGICEFTSVLLPTYCISIAFVTGSLTAVGYYQGTAFLIMVLEYLTTYVLLPMAQVYLLLSFASCMQRKPIFSKLVNLIENAFSWIQKTIIGVALAFGAIQSILIPAVDRLKKSAVIQTASAIPGVGNLINGAWETVMGAGIVLKNALGIGGVCLLFFIGLLPLCNLALRYLMYRFIGAVTEPVIQEQTEQLLFHAGTAQKLLLQTVGMGMFLFLLLLVVMTRITV